MHITQVKSAPEFPVHLPYEQARLDFVEQQLQIRLRNLRVCSQRVNHRRHAYELLGVVLGLVYLVLHHLLKQLEDSYLHVRQQEEYAINELVNLLLVECPALTHYNVFNLLARRGLNADFNYLGLHEHVRVLVRLHNKANPLHQLQILKLRGVSQRKVVLQNLVLHEIIKHQTFVVFYLAGGYLLYEEHLNLVMVRL